MDIKELTDKIKQLKTLNDKVEELKYITSVAEDEAEKLSSEIYNMFKENNITSQKVEGVGCAHLHSYTHVSVANSEEFLTYLKSTGQGGMIKEAVPLSTVGAFVRGVLKDKGEIPPGVKVFTSNKITIRRS